MSFKQEKDLLVNKFQPKEANLYPKTKENREHHVSYIPTIKKKDNKAWRSWDQK